MNNNHKKELKITIPHMPLIKGLIAIVLGIILIAYSIGTIMRAVLFVTGLLLTYYGLLALEIKHLTNYIDIVVDKVKHMLGKLSK